MMRFSRYLLLLMIPSFIPGCRGSGEFTTYEKSGFMMDTFVQIFIYDNSRPAEEIEGILGDVLVAMKEVESLTNIYADSSLVSRINREAGSRPVSIDSTLHTILGKSRSVSELSQGAFDISVNPLLRLWKFFDENPQLPAAKEIESTLKLVNYQAIQVTDSTIRFSEKGMSIDLGGIAKGYAVDRAMQVLKKHGIRDAMVNAGGDIGALSSSLTAGKRKVWIRHPRQRERLYGFFYVDEGSVATSGDYERFFFADSVRYHHILDPKTGYPARGCVSVTIYSSDATLADALATAVFVLGPEKGMDLIHRLNGIEGVILYEKEGKLKNLISEGLAGKLKVIE